MTSEDDDSRTHHTLSGSATSERMIVCPDCAEYAIAMRRPHGQGLVVVHNPCPCQMRKAAADAVESRWSKEWHGWLRHYQECLGKDVNNNSNTLIKSQNEGDDDDDLLTPHLAASDVAEDLRDDIQSIARELRKWHIRWKRDGLPDEKGRLHRVAQLERRYLKQLEHLVDDVVAVDDDSNSSNKDDDEDDDGDDDDQNNSSNSIPTVPALHRLRRDLFRLATHWEATMGTVASTHSTESHLATVVQQMADLADLIMDDESNNSIVYGSDLRELQDALEAVHAALQDVRQRFRLYNHNNSHSRNKASTTALIRQIRTVMIAYSDLEDMVEDQLLECQAAQDNDSNNDNNLQQGSNHLIRIDRRMTSSGTTAATSMSSVSSSITSSTLEDSRVLEYESSSVMTTTASASTLPPEDSHDVTEAADVHNDQAASDDRASGISPRSPSEVFLAVMKKGMANLTPSAFVKNNDDDDDDTDVADNGMHDDCTTHSAHNESKSTSSDEKKEDEPKSMDPTYSSLSGMSRRGPELDRLSVTANGVQALENETAAKDSKSQQLAPQSGVTGIMDIENKLNHHSMSSGGDVHTVANEVETSPTSQLPHSHSGSKSGIFGSLDGFSGSAGIFEDNESSSEGPIHIDSSRGDQKHLVAAASILLASQSSVDVDSSDDDVDPRTSDDDWKLAAMACAKEEDPAHDAVPAKKDTCDAQNNQAETEDLYSRSNGTGTEAEGRISDFKAGAFSDVESLPGLEDGYTASAQHGMDQPRDRVFPADADSEKDCAPSAARDRIENASGDQKSFGETAVAADPPIGDANLSVKKETDIQQGWVSASPVSLDCVDIEARGLMTGMRKQTSLEEDEAVGYRGDPLSHEPAQSLGFSVGRGLESSEVDGVAKGTLDHENDDADGFTSGGHDEAASALIGHMGGVRCCIPFDGGRKLISGSVDTTLRLWDLASRKTIMVLTGHTGVVRCCDVFEEEGLVLSGSFDRSLRLWNLNAENHFVRELVGHTGYIRCCRIFNDGKHAISGGDDNALLVWELSTGDVLRSIDGHRDSIHECVMLDSTRTAFTACKDNVLRVWDLIDEKCTSEIMYETKQFRQHTTKYVWAGAIFGNGKILAGSGPKELTCWQISTGRPLTKLKDSPDDITCCAVFPDGRSAISGNTDNTLRVWDIATGEIVNIFEGHMDVMTNIVLVPESCKAVSASEDGTLRVWDLESHLFETDKKEAALPNDIGEAQYFDLRPKPADPGGVSPGQVQRMPRPDPVQQSEQGGQGQNDESFVLDYKHQGEDVWFERTFEVEGAPIANHGSGGNSYEAVVSDPPLGAARLGQIVDDSDSDASFDV